MPKFWQGHIVADGVNFFLSSSSWRQLANGGTSKVVWSTPYPVTIKNVGKANETTPEEQAEKEYFEKLQSYALHHEIIERRPNKASLWFPFIYLPVTINGA